MATDIAASESLITRTTCIFPSFLHHCDRYGSLLTPREGSAEISPGGSRLTPRDASVEGLPAGSPFNICTVVSLSLSWVSTLRTPSTYTAMRACSASLSGMTAFSPAINVISNPSPSYSNSMPVPDIASSRFSPTTLVRPISFTLSEVNPIFIAYPLIDT